MMKNREMITDIKKMRKKEQEIISEIELSNIRELKIYEILSRLDIIVSNVSTDLLIDMIIYTTRNV